MVDSVTKTTSTSGCQNFLNSFVAAAMGFVLFVVAFPVLWWNQGRIDLGKVAETSLAVTSPSAENDGKLVSVTGDLSTTETLGDPPYLKPGAYVALNRDAEMYAWHERSESTTKDKIGGGTETTTTYSYEHEWTSSPDDSSRFEKPDGHHNPPMTIDSKQQSVAEAKVGEFLFSAPDCSLPVNEDVALDEGKLEPGLLTRRATDWLSPAPVTAFKLEGGYLFQGHGTLGNPDVGDIRISYQALTPGQSVTMFGQAQGNRVSTYTYKEKAHLFRLFKSGRDEAIAQLKLEHKMIGYAIGFAGFFMMWIGMTMVFSPLTQLAHVIPFVGHLAERAIGCATFPVALVLTFIVVMVSKVLHSPILALGLGVIVAVGMVVVLKNMAKKREMA